MSKIFFITALVSVFATGSLMAQDWELSKDSVGKKSMKKDSMGKKSMNKDSVSSNYYYVTFTKEVKIPAVDVDATHHGATYTVSEKMDSTVTFYKTGLAKSVVKITSMAALQKSGPKPGPPLAVNINPDSVRLKGNFYPPGIKIATLCATTIRTETIAARRSLTIAVTASTAVILSPSLSFTATILIPAGDTTNKTIIAPTNSTKVAGSYTLITATNSATPALVSCLISRTSSGTVSTISCSAIATVTRSVTQQIISSLSPYKITDSLIIAPEDQLYSHVFRNRHHYKFLLDKEFGIYLGINYTPAFADNIVEINQPQFKDYAALDSRSINEYPRLMYGSFNVQAGYIFNYGHVVFAQFNTTEKGFQYLKPLDFNPVTGKDTTGTKMYQRFLYRGFGLGYKCINSHRHPVNFLFESTVNFNWLMYNGQVNRLDRFSCSGKIGMGMSINITQYMDINILPNMIYDFTRLHGSVFNTRFYNMGVDFGLGFRLWRKKDRHARV